MSDDVSVGTAVAEESAMAQTADLPASDKDLTSDERLALSKRLWDLFAVAVRHQTPWRHGMADIDEMYYHHKQWTDKEIKELEKKHRMAVAINEIAPQLDRILGDALDFDLDANIIPVPGIESTEDVEETAAQVYTSILAQAKVQSGLEFHIDDMKRDALMVGRGWLEIVVDEDNKNRILFDYSKWGEVWWDPYVRDEYTLKDARFICRGKWVPLAVAKEDYPDAAEYLDEWWNNTTAPDQIEMQSSTEDYDIEYWTKMELQHKDSKNSQIKLIEMWYFDEGKVRHAVFTSNLLIYDEASPIEVDIIPMIAYTIKVDEKGLPYGYVRGMRDLQDVVNKRHSKALFALDVRQAWIRQGAVADINALRDQVAQPDSVIEFDGEYDKDVHVETHEGMSAQQYSIFSDSINRMREIGGGAEFRGIQTNARSGQAIRARKESGSALHVPTFRNLRRTYDHLYRTLRKLVEHYWTDDQIIRVTNDEDAAEYIRINAGPDGKLNLVEAGERFDLIIDMIPASKDQRLRELEMLMNLGKTGVPIPPEAYIENTNLKNKKKYIKIMHERMAQAAQPSPKDQADIQRTLAQANEAVIRSQKSQIQMQEMMADMQETKAKTEGQYIENALLLEKLQAIESGMVNINDAILGREKKEPEKKKEDKK